MNFSLCLNTEFLPQKAEKIDLPNCFQSNFCLVKKCNFLLSWNKRQIKNRNNYENVKINITVASNIKNEVHQQSKFKYFR